MGYNKLIRQLYNATLYSVVIICRPVAISWQRKNKSTMKMRVYMRNIFIIIGALLLMSACASMSNPKPVKWTVQDVSYGTDELQTFNIIIPEGKNSVHAIVYIHGGFYYAGNKLWHPLFLTDYSESVIFASIDYRLLKTQDNTVHIQDMISDVDSALAKISEVAREKGVTIEDFILMGHSSGGHIALLYAYQYFQENDKRPIKIAAVVGLSAPSDYTDDFSWSSMSHYGEYLPHRLAELSAVGTALTGHNIELTRYDWTAQDNYSEYKDFIEEISPITYIYKTEKIPPTLLVHGINDRIVPFNNSVKLGAALDNTSVHHHTIMVGGPGNDHMLGGASNRTDSVKPITYTDHWWIDEAKKWLETYLQ
jgi:acetyl esterase/lipase